MGFTTEVSCNWDCLNFIYNNAIKRISEEFPHVDDLTMLGAHSSHSYQTGMLLAERLGWPCIRNVVEVKCVNSINTCLKVTSKTNGNILVQKVTPPWY
jgi:electron transfer flavoprotein alpha/beta subunit